MLYTEKSHLILAEDDRYVSVLSNSNRIRTSSRKIEIR